MSLVNDMLRDLEERRAAPGERLALDGLQAVDETAAARRDTVERLRRGSIWFMAVMLIAVLIGVMIGRVVNGQIPWGGVMPKREAEAVATPVTAAPRVLDVLPQTDARGLTLQLLLERSVPYQRTEESGAVSLRLPGVQLAHEARSGRLQRNGRSLSWRVENQGADVQVLLVGLGEGLQVSDRLETAGDRWMLWVEVPLTEPLAPAETPPALDPLLPAVPAAEPVPEPALPAWASAPVASAGPVEPPAAPAAVAEPTVKIEPYRPDGLARARQALQAGDYPKAIDELEALHKSRGSDPEVLRWLARAYLAGGQQQRLLAWLPAQLARMPQDSELRLLLARTRLQAGDTRGAVTTLEQNAPSLAQEPTYHALLAASYQQTGQWRESAGLYRQLVALRPGQSTWQLGLGIALEQLDQPAEAAQHYRLALAGAGLDDSARQFASERAAALGGRR
jgi:MSHA biogenesis protein MshN